MIRSASRTVVFIQRSRISSRSSSGIRQSTDDSRSRVDSVYSRIAADADRLNYRAVIRKLIASNDEDMREDAEIREDFTRDGQPVSEARKQIGALLWRRMHLLAALEHCPPWCLRATLLALRVPLTEEEKALFSFLSVLWPEDEQ